MWPASTTPTPARWSTPWWCSTCPAGPASRRSCLAQLARRVLGQARSQSWYTAQTGGDAGRTFRREWLPILRSSGLARHLKISLRAGGESFELVARSSSATCFRPGRSRALHGTNVDLAVIDEAWAHDSTSRPRHRAGRVPGAADPAGRPDLDRVRRRDPRLDVVRRLARAGRGRPRQPAGPVSPFSSGAPTPPPRTTTRPTRRVWWTAHPALGDTITERRRGRRAGAVVAISPPSSGRS